MCATSAVYDYGYQNPPWHYPRDVHPSPAIPTFPNLPDLEAVEAMKKFVKLVEGAKEFDRATKQPDCEDPKKAKFMQEILDRLAAIEKRLSVQPSI